MKKICLLLLAIFSFAAITNAQSSANYTFSTNNNGSLSVDLNSNTVDMSTGTTQLIAAGVDATASPVTTIPFDFYLMGTKFTQFSVNEDGILQLGATVVGTNLYTINTGTAALPKLGAFNSDMRTGTTTGKVHYKITGTAPNRALIIEFTNMQLFYTSPGTAGTSTFQMRLYETSGVIEYVYGTMSVTDVTTGNRAASIGFYTGAASGAFASVLFATHTNSTTSPYAANPNIAATGPITELTSATDGNRRYYRFSPPVPATPTGLNFTSVGAGAMTVNWTDNSTSEYNFAVLRSTDNINFTQVATVASTTTAGTGTTYSSVQSGLSGSTTYYWKIVAMSEGAMSASLNGSQLTTACSISGTKTVGPTGNYPTLTAALADLSLNGLAGATILELQPAYTSAGETFPIVIGAIPCASAANPLTIRPQAGATALSITSANTTGTINFNGGSYVTIDGRAGGAGASQLTISNTATAGYAMQFINSATFNTIKYSSIQGVNTGTTSGVIFFNTATGLTVGNSNNTIDNCDIAAGATTPTNLIFASGTATSFGSQNNSNTVSNCTLHDWFNASSTTSGAAINITSAASDWTITANSFYQTASRTFTMTTATDQGAIFIASTANNSANFTISNNFIGGTAPSCGGTPLTWSGTGTTGTPTPRMIRVSTAAAATNNITGNTIANMAFVSASTSTAYGLIAVLNGNTNISNNTLGSQSATGNITCLINGTSTASFFLPISIGTGATISNYNVTNNNIGGITISANTTAASSFRVIYAQPVAGSLITITGNSIGGTVANSIQQLTGGAAAGNGSLFGILILNPTIGNVITNNIVRNMTLNNATAVGASLTGINVQSSGGGHIITGNTIFNLSANTANLAINNAASVVGLTMTGNVVGGGNISGNTIYNLTNTNAAVAGWINGMYFGTAPAPQPTTIIAKNFVHSISLSSNVAGTGMVGIFFPNTGPAVIYNNMVRLGIDANGNALTTQSQINGIYKASSGAANISFNTVYIGGTGVASGAVSTFAFRRGTSAAGDSVTNNIFYNARSNASGTGKHYAINLNNTTTITSNYNDLFANGTGGVLGIINTTDYATIPAWQTGSVGLDGNSISGNPGLLNATGNAAVVDLHIDAANPTPIEQAGIALPNVTLDYDDQARSGLTPTDIGADAGNFTALDIAPPAIIYTPLTVACNTGDRTFTATITDATGVPTGGALRPRVYYKKGAGSYFSQPGTLSSGTGTNGTWSFTIVASDMGGLAVGDVVSYYVIAQDAAGNISSNPGGVVATDVNTITTPPTPNTYTVSATLSGTYTVGAGGAYTTLTAAVAAYNASCLGGPVIFSLTDATYPSETFPITINQNANASSVNTLTIRPATGVTPTITGSNATALITLNAADWITIDGSSTGATATGIGGNAALRGLTIQNTATTSTGTTILVAAGTTGATNNNIRNLNVLGNDPATSLLCISISGAAPGTSPTINNDNNTVENCSMQKSILGVFYNGVSTASPTVGAVITKNDLSATGANRLKRGAIFFFNQNGIQVTQNKIGGITTDEAADGIGIMAGIQNINTTATTSGAVTNAVITNNIIDGVASTSTTGFSAAGIAIAGDVTSNTIANNMISGITAPSTSPDFVAGIFVAGVTGSSTKIYNNTISLSGDRGSIASQIGSFGIAISGTNPTVDIRNNIISSSQTSGGGANAKSYIIGMTTSTFTNLTSNYNDLIVTGANAAGFHTGTLDAGGTDYATLAAWQAATTKDANSTNVAPVFVSASDLHLSTAAAINWCLNGVAPIVGGITTDIDGDTRGAGTPPNGSDIGADEINVTGFTVTNPAAVCSPATVDLTAAAVTAGSDPSLTYTYFTDAAGTTPLANPNAVAVSGTYYIKASTPGGCFWIKPVVVSIGTPPSATINYSGSPFCQSGGTANVTQTGTTGGTYSSTAGLSINASTGAITLGTSTPGTYTVTYGFPASGGCPAANFTTSVTITATPSATISYPGSPYCNTALTAPVTQTGTTGGTYSSTAGLVINASTGLVNLFTSTPGTYTVTYTVAAAGGCSTYVTTAPITIVVCPPSAVTVAATLGTTGPIGYNTLKEGFDAINAGTHMGVVTVNINNSTNEGATPAVLNGSGIGAASYTSVSIRPTGDAIVVAGGTIPTTRGVIEFNGADNVTLDGDNASSAGINRNLTITATGTTASTTLIWIKTPSAADGCTNNIIRNCIIRGQDQVNTTIGILSGGSTFGGVALAPNSNTTISNNAFSRSQNGIFWFGFGTSPFDANLIIDGNTFGSTVAADKHIFRGLITQNTSNFTISNNIISGVASLTTSGSIMHGIQIAGSVAGGNIFNNRISDIKQTSTSGFGADGIMLAPSTTASNINVYNNFISDVTGFGFNGFGNNDNGNGISIAGGGGFNIYHNTVLMNTNQGSTAGNPSALLVTTAVTTNASINLRNNILVNAQTNGGNRYAIASAAPASRFVDINYNDYNSTGANLGNIGGTNVATLAALQTATTKDANSTNALPVFVSATDLHLTAAGNCALDGTATPIATVTTDIDNAVRSATTPDIGADEFASAPRTATIAYNSAPYCVSGGTATVTQTGSTGGVYTAPAGVTINASTGAITLGTSTPGTYTITYTLPVLGACPVFTTTTSITINAAPSATISYAGSPYCQNAGTANVTQTGSTGGTYSSTAGLVINATTGAVTLGTSTPGTYTVTYTIPAANGCAVFTTTTTITITAPPTATISYTGSPYCQNAGTATVTQTGSTGGTYSSTAGLVINASTGAVTLGTSTPGTYTVTYTIAAAGGCAAFSTTASITITATPSATISYTGSPYCQNAGTANVTRTGTAGGTYSSTAGLTINASTGAVTLGTSTPGTYTVTYTVAASGGCAVFTTTTSITITTPPSATINYAGSPYCGTGTATVTRTGTAGGTYSSTAGIVINATTGDVNLSASTPGTYTVTYTVAAAGGCAVYTTTASITINTTSTAPTGATTSVTTNCGPATGVVLSVTGGSLGTGGAWKWYTGSCGGTLVGTGASITLNVAATTTYYVRAEGTCNTTTCASVTVTINPQPTISIAANPYTSLMPGWTTTLTATINPVVAGNTIVWYRNGSVVSGATGNSINVTVDELGSYTARVTSPFGCTALSSALLIKDSATNKLFISPNPNSGRFKIRYYTSAQNFGFLRTVLIYDSKGAIVYNKRLPITAPYSSMDIDMTNAAKGIYMVVVADYQGKPLAQGKVDIQ